MKHGFSISSKLRRASLAAALLAGVGTLGAQAQTPPRIFSAAFEGKKLIVIGANFGDAAKILIDGEPRKTKNLADDPTGTLVVKKGRKQIGANQIVTLNVVNPDGGTSPEFRFFGGPTITLADHGKTIDLSVGEQFLVSLGGGYGWTVNYASLSNIVAVPTLLPILGSQGIFEPVAPDKVGFSATGEPRCGKDDPSCPKTSFTFEVTLVIHPND